MAVGYRPLLREERARTEGSRRMCSKLRNQTIERGAHTLSEKCTNL
jgi:hypothetical protein